MSLITVAVPRPGLGARRLARDMRAPLRRSLPASAARRRLENALLALCGVVVFFDIEFCLAYVLYVAAQLVD